MSRTTKSPLTLARTAYAISKRGQTLMICELVQVGGNLDPWNASTASGGGVMENVCDRFFYALTDANFNVLGLALEGPGATPVERYEYTPYGERTVFTHGFIPEDLDFDGRVTSDDVLAANAFAGRSDPEAQVADLDGDGAVTQADVDRVTAAFEKQSPAAAGRDPWVSYAAFHSAPVPYTPFAGSGVSGGRAVGLCEVGHQGLLHDELPGGTLVYNRSRMLHPGLGRFAQRDPLEYIDDINFYQYEGSSPLNYVDPEGFAKRGAPRNWGGHRRKPKPLGTPLIRLRPGGGGDFWWYGNWGGPGWTNGNWGNPDPIPNPGDSKYARPEDDQDACYEQHDRCFDDCRCTSGCVKAPKKCARGCDDALQGCLLKALFNGNPGDRGKCVAAICVFIFTNR